MCFVVVGAGGGGGFLFVVVVILVGLFVVLFASGVACLFMFSFVLLEIDVMCIFFPDL